MIKFATLCLAQAPTALKGESRHVPIATRPPRSALSKGAWPTLFSRLCGKASGRCTSLVDPLRREPWCGPMAVEDGWIPAEKARLGISGATPWAPLLRLAEWLPSSGGEEIGKQLLLPSSGGPESRVISRFAPPPGGQDHGWSLPFGATNAAAVPDTLHFSGGLSGHKASAVDHPGGPPRLTRLR